MYWLIVVSSAILYGKMFDQIGIAFVEGSQFCVVKITFTGHVRVFMYFNIASIICQLWIMILRSLALQVSVQVFFISSTMLNHGSTFDCSCFNPA